MRGFFTFFILLYTGLGLSQNVNYESLVLNYYVNQLENRNLFDDCCDCLSPSYKLKKTLLVYDSTYIKADWLVASTVFSLEKSNSEDAFKLRTEDLSLKLEVTNTRVKLTSNPTDFGQKSYLIRFSQRIYYQDWVIISFNLKSDATCSGFDFFFFCDKKGEILNLRKFIWCDNQG